MAGVHWVHEDEYGMPEEFPTTIHVNGRRLTTLQTTRMALEDWAHGFLYAEGYIQSPDDVRSMVVNRDRGQVWVRLQPGLPRAATHPRAPSRSAATAPRVSQAQLAAFQAQMQRSAVLYALTGGMHVAGVFRVSSGEMIAREDVGRHNTVDKVIGAALRAGWDPSNLVLLCSGRISHEMCRKIVRFGITIAASRSAATDQAVRLARRLGIEMIGYLRPHGMRIYTSGHRLVGERDVEGACCLEPIHQTAIHSIQEE